MKLVYLVGQYTCKLFNIATQTHHFDEFLVQLEEWEPKPSAKYCQSPLLKTRFEDFLEWFAIMIIIQRAGVVQG